jgi:hypothetical protein
MMEDREIVHFKQRYNEGHSWGLWRATTDQGFMFLFGGGVNADIEEKTEVLDLSIQPNPFYSTTTIRFSDRSGPAVVEIVDLAGRMVYSHRISAGTDSWLWEPPSSIAAGRYIAYIVNNERSTGAPVIYLK